jgi:hypothetical protein
VSIELQISDAAGNAMAKRNIQVEDVSSVIEWAETSAEKLYRPGEDVYLAKKTIGNATFYVRYSPAPQGYIVHTAYLHRSVIVSAIVQDWPMEEWYCYKDKVKMVEAYIGAHYLDRTQYFPGLKCPKCDAAYLMEQMTEQLRQGEQMLEPK